MSESIKVFVKIRPPIPDENKQSEIQKLSIQVLDNKQFEQQNQEDYMPILRLSRGLYEQKDYSFDNILGQNTTQDQVFNVVCNNLIDDALSGINRTILTYGQTSSGKTYTLFGPSSEPILSGRGDFSQINKTSGLLPRVCYSLFQQIQQQNIQAKIVLSYVQIYKDDVYDLLTQKMGPKLQFQNMQTPTMTKISVTSAQQVLQLITQAVQQRQVAATQMNAQSSRSHVIFQLHISTSNNYQSLLTLVDLAGSERVNRTLSSGERLEEAKKINQSLSCLGKCISALSTHQKHIPYRDCALTKILAESLSGNCRTFLIATVCPLESNFDESNSTLQFAQRCQKVTTKPKINEHMFEQLNKQQIDYNTDIQMTLKGEFGVENNVGFVKCQCPRCGVNLVAFDQDIDEQEYYQQTQIYDQNQDNELNYQHFTQNLDENQSNQSNSQEIIQNLQNEVITLQQQNQNLQKMLDQFLNGINTMTRCPDTRRLILQNINSEDTTQQQFDQPNTTRSILRESELTKYELPPPAPRYTQNHTSQNQVQFQQNENDDQLEIFAKKQNKNLKSQIIEEDEETVQLSINPNQYTNKPITLISSNELTYKQFQPPKLIQLKKNYPQVVYDKRTKTVEVDEQ
ncbi:Kinesin-like_protein [Hexamita inflata]|uniref:Kinesin-like protein n=1 Tax=Hexamita inflata TaxID=28002 RepID=A0AA86QNV1_9EUKA|nr:Kinesin-like protein [Hexamita inflata]